MGKSALKYPETLAYCLEHGCPITSTAMETYNKNKAVKEARERKARDAALAKATSAAEAKALLQQARAERCRSTQVLHFQP